MIVFTVFRITSKLNTLLKFVLNKSQSNTRNYHRLYFIFLTQYRGNLLEWIADVNISRWEIVLALFHKLISSFVVIYYELWNLYCSDRGVCLFYSSTGNTVLEVTQNLSLSIPTLHQLTGNIDTIKQIEHNIIQRNDL